MSELRYNRISIVLDEFRIDQKDLAKLIKVTKDTVSRWCRNENQPRIPELYRIARVFRIDVCRLLEPTNWQHESGPTAVEILKAEKEKAKQKGKTKNINKRPASSRGKI
jgi:transcriptional regulator with XRE-family HTH domain